jgi:hypothetical protein
VLLAKVNSTAQLQTRDCFTLILGYKLCSHTTRILHNIHTNHTTRMLHNINTKHTTRILHNIHTKHTTRMLPYGLCVLYGWYVVSGLCVLLWSSIVSWLYCNDVLVLPWLCVLYWWLLLMIYSVPELSTLHSFCVVCIVLTLYCILA